MMALILLGHGARDPGWAEPLLKVRAALARVRPGLAVESAFLELMTPTLEEAVDTLARRGMKRMVIVPVFLAQGGHLKRELPARLDALRQRHPGCTLLLAGVAGEAPEVIAAITAHAVAQMEAFGND